MTGDRTSGSLQTTLSTLTVTQPNDTFICTYTCNLANICIARVPTYHIAEAANLVSPVVIRHRPVGAPSTARTAERTTSGWLPGGRLRCQRRQLR